MICFFFVPLLVNVWIEYEKSVKLVSVTHKQARNKFIFINVQEKRFKPNRNVSQCT